MLKAKSFRILIQRQYNRTINKMFTLTRNKHHIITPIHHRTTENAMGKAKEEDVETESSSSSKRNSQIYKRLHRNACRTKVTQFLEYRSQKIKIRLHPSMWMISQTYLKKLQNIPVVHQPSEEVQPARKISWSEEGEYVVFNVRKNSASIAEASRHKYSLND